MTLQGTFPTKLFTTDFALEILDLEMNHSKVLISLALVIETFLILRATVRF
jgi:hypothetical protein